MKPASADAIPILVTGAAGFVGAAVSEALLRRGDKVVGLDDLNTYYDPGLKEARLARLKAYPGFTFAKVNIAEREKFEKSVAPYHFKKIIHLAAQAGVRFSIDQPHVYIESNISGFLNILELCRRSAVENFVYASSSSVYGASTEIPFRLGNRADQPVSLYGATKRSNELMAHSYSHLFSFPSVGLRFFTVYGPWGRPDMAYFSFTKKILEGTPIQIHNFGKHRRDFTHIDDVVRAVLAVADEKRDTANRARVYNIGNSSPVNLSDLVSEIEKATGKKAIQEMVEQKAGDVLDTFADVTDFERDFGFRPKTKFSDGISNFVKWYQDYFARSSSI
jgi:UDP-glucuronate 4-epimerase